MSEPTPTERAEALIHANPRDRAVYEFALAFTERREQDAAAAYLLLAALATIRAILGADVPAIPTPERSES